MELTFHKHLNARLHKYKDKINISQANLTKIASKFSSTIEGPKGSVIGSVSTVKWGLID
jgi:hypothetical protein